ncbi:hypothetical protein [Streptomyces sp. NPDC007346]|uniref:hypothetical protein n=1 Tax=Streptomyces sp. NPDC007346 TaxID=3154682 RepID=UPI0034531E93
MSEKSTEKPAENWTTALRYISGRKTAEESLGFLAHISSTIRGTAEPRDVVPATAKACVPFFASAISLEAPAVHDEPVVQGPDEFAAALAEVRALAESAGRPRFVVSEHEGFSGQTDPRVLEQLRERGIGSAVALALDFRGVFGGHLVIVRGPAHRRGPVGPGDLALVSEVADRVAAFNAFAFASRPAADASQ